MNYKMDQGLIAMPRGHRGTCPTRVGVQRGDPDGYIEVIAEGLDPTRVRSPIVVEPMGGGGWRP